MGIVSVFFIALYALNSRCLLILNSGREAVAAQQALQDRVEQLRSCTYAQITNASYLQSSLLCTATNSSANLSSPTETVTVNAYPTAINPQVKVVRTGVCVGWSFTSMRTSSTSQSGQVRPLS